MIFKNKAFYISDGVSDSNTRRFVKEFLQRGAVPCKDPAKADIVIFNAEKRDFDTEIATKNEKKTYMTDTEAVLYFDMTVPDNHAEFIVKKGVLIRWIYQESNDSTLVIPEGVKRIDSNAFHALYPCQASAYRKEARRIFKIIFPKSLEVIEKDAFRGFTGLDSVIFKKGVRELGGFRGCTRLKSITIPKDCENITDYAFAGCTALENVDWSESVKKIGDHAFEKTAISEFHSWKKLTYIGSYAFSNIPRLSVFRLKSDNLECGDGICRYDSGLNTVSLKCGALRLHRECFRSWRELQELEVEGDVFASSSAFSKNVILRGLETLDSPDTPQDFRRMIQRMIRFDKASLCKFIPDEDQQKHADVFKHLTDENDPVLNEAYSRLKLLQKQIKMKPKVAEYYKKGVLSYSWLVCEGLLGILGTILYRYRLVKIVEEIERDYGIHVYHCIDTPSLWESAVFLYVEKNPDDWPEGRPKNGYVLAYVYNFEQGFGEFGMVRLAAENGILYRVG